MKNMVKNNGQVFTPNYLVNLILDEIGYMGKDILRKHCIDNSCGDGAFLVEIVRRYIHAYQEEHASLEGVESELVQYIHGIEIESDAFRHCVENVKDVCLSCGLVSSHVDLIHANALEIHEFDGIMDYVVGNPPYVRVHNLEDNFNLVKGFSFANGGMTNLYLAFFEIGFRMLNDGGKLCYITPSSWLNSIAGKNMRNYVIAHRNLCSVIDLAHFQPFSATTYVLISLFQKGARNESFTYNEFCSETLSKKYVCNIPFEKVCINGCFYLAKEDSLDTLRNIFNKPTKKYVLVKNGFATLADKVFIGNDFPFSEFLIPVVKGSTGEWHKAFFPYDVKGNPIPKDRIFANDGVSRYLGGKKKELLKESSEEENQNWHLYGRTQAIKDVWKDKISVNTIVKDTNSIKLHFVPMGGGVYSGLYILTSLSMAVICASLVSDGFVQFVTSLKKYKSGGYYTFNSGELEQYLNYEISKLVEKGIFMARPIDE